MTTGVNFLSKNEEEYPVLMKKLVGGEDGVDYASMSAFDINNNIFSSNIEEEVEKFASHHFAVCVVKFNKASIQVTSGDMFFHNHSSTDDCGSVISLVEFHTTPTAKIVGNLYMGSLGVSSVGPFGRGVLPAATYDC
jgi:hypothetical protein